MNSLRHLEEAIDLLRKAEIELADARSKDDIPFSCTALVISAAETTRAAGVMAAHVRDHDEMAEYAKQYRKAQWDEQDT